MHGDIVRRGIIFIATVFVHYKNICIMGLCEPASQHEQLVVSDTASLIFTLAVALVLFDAELWPRRTPFRPMPANMIFVLELTITLVISNLMLRIVWLPFVHVALQYINCTISDIILKLNSYFIPRGKNNGLAKFASSTCSPEGVSMSATFVSLVIFTRVVYTLYGERLICVYNALARCACVKSKPTPEEIRGRARKRTCASLTGRRGNVDSYELQLPAVMLGAENVGLYCRSSRLHDQGNGEPILDNQAQE